MLNEFIYTDVHQLNLDWIVRKIKELENMKVKDMAPADTIINIADVVDAPLSNDNIVDAIREALKISSYIFIPNGKYTFNISLSQDCHIIMDKDAVIQSDNASPCIEMHNSAFSLTGGAVESGLNDDSRTLYGDSTGALVYCYDCKDVHIENVKSTHSKHAAIFRFKGSENITINNCHFNNFLLSAIWFTDFNRNIHVSNCSFMYAKRPTGHEYCYFVCTGASKYTERLTPPDGYIVENCYGYDSEDCGIDTHGARNVIFRNNVVLQTICALTAYNDNNRALRPIGWNMENILIENNYCESDRDNEPGRLYPHPFIFVGASNAHTEDDVGYEDNPGSYYSYCNLTIRNNYFKSPNTYGPDVGTIFLDSVARNVLIENNVIDSCKANRSFRPYRCIDLTVTGNTFLNTNGQGAWLNSKGYIARNTGDRFYSSTSQYSCIDGDGAMGDALHTSRSTLMKMGQVYNDGTNMKMSTSYGIRLRSDMTLPAAQTVVITDGIAALADHGYIPGLAVKLTDGGGTTYNRYVSDVLDMKYFIITTNAMVPMADGTYTIELLSDSTTTL